MIIPAAFTALACIAYKSLEICERCRQRKNDEWSHYFRRPDVHGIDALHARFVRDRFSNHAHDYFVIGVVEERTQTYQYRGARQTTPTAIFHRRNINGASYSEAV
jgi:AraC-like ligand binding domain